ncbi:MAG: patatin-like phospholipase family protein [Cytophagaceae bacterium]|jgi:hypothetical protein|nr:patatin-like phospholipase family protein [Cytophagaceae bacterium]
MRTLKSTYKSTWENLYYSFPVQLLLNNFKKNQILLVLWFILIAVVTRSLGNMMGIPSLFLDPEYLGVTDFKGFLIIGVSLGIFITAFHITVYILDSFRFPFLGATPLPFSHFCLNNSFFPILLVSLYVIQIFEFQHQLGFQSYWEIVGEVSAMVFGLLITIFLLFLYFKKTNKDVFRYLAQSVDKSIKKNPISRVNVLKDFKINKRNKYKVNHYITLKGTIEPTPDQSAYDKQILLRVFDQNHLNAVIVEVFLITVIILLGLFRDSPYFQIPAAASGILFFSIIVMFTGAFSYWLRGWAISVLIGVFLMFNFLMKYDFIQSSYQAFGINYSKAPVEYNLAKLRSQSNRKTYQADQLSTLQALENWKKQFPEGTKPKMVFVCVSGGGQRAAVWSMRTLQYVDSATNGRLMQHTRLMTGASGGLIGAAYYRELYWQKQQGKDIALAHSKYFYNMSKDVLNPIIFSMVVNDLFFRFQKFTDGKHEYYKDRGYAFEQKLHENTEQVLNKPIQAYRNAEEQGKIPMMIISPTVINDGRRLYISPMDVSYMNLVSDNGAALSNSKIKGIEFRKLFVDHDAERLHFMSALRMSATFPYVTPNVDLPSNPSMEIMDAGLSDNFGIRDAVKFMYVFQEWIEENTSGVVFVNIRDSEKNLEIEKNNKTSIFQKVVAPIGSLYDNWDYYQDLNNDNLLDYATSWLDIPLDVVEFEYIPNASHRTMLEEKKLKEHAKFNERAALSWHLNTREKESLRRTIFEANNQSALKRLVYLLE